MEIEFDPAKDSANIVKHGASLRAGLAILTDPMADVVDDRFDYGEERRLAFAQIEAAWWACVYTMRGTAHRIISVHRVSEKEVARWLK